MTYKELTEQVKRDCKLLMVKNEEQARFASNSITRLPFDNAAAAYQTVIGIIETYENCLNTTDDEKLNELAEDYATHRPYDVRWSEWLSCKKAYIAGYKKTKEE